MFKKETKNRKTKPNPKLIISRSKLPKQPIKQKVQIKERKISNKHNHQSSTFTLLSNHNNSQFSLIDADEDNVRKGKSKNMRQSVTSLLGKEPANKDKDKQKQKSKKELTKNKKNSSVNPNSKSRKNISKVSPAKIDKNSKILKQNPKKSKLLNQQQLYEHINLALYKTKTNSQINFSNNSSVRDNNISNSNLYINYLGKNRNQSKNTNKKTLTIDCSDQYILNQYFSNSRIKNSERKRSDAAVKIQKVFRGFLTRKMLQEFIEKQEEKLYEMEKRMKSCSSRQSEDFSIKQLKNQHRQEEKGQTIISDKFQNNFFKPKQQQPIEQHNPLTTPQIKQKQDSTKQLKNPPAQLQIDLSLKQSKKQIFPPINHSALEEQSSIYPQQHDSISRYLPFNENNQINELDDQSEIYENYDNVRLNEGEAYGNYQEDYQESSQIDRKEGGQVVGQKQAGKYKEISEELFKYTPSSRAPKSKSKIEEPMPTDFSQKRVHQFESDLQEGKSKQLPEFLKPNDAQAKPPKKLELQNETNQNASKNNKRTDNDKKDIFLLKKEQKQKWNKIIQMLSHQIVETKSKNQDNEKFMRMILDFSKRNKEELEKSTSNVMYTEENNESNKKQNRQNNLTFLKDQISLELSPSKMMSRQFQRQQKTQKNRQEQIKYESKEQKNQNMPFLTKKPPHLNINLYNCHIPKSHNKQNYSLFEKTEQLKNFYKKNFAAYPIEEMVQIRQKALEKREKDMMNKLNEDLTSMALTHQQFIERLSQMQERFENERNMINKAKMEIFIGYRATHRLMQDSVKDAWYLGFKIPFSQSLKDFKGTNHNNLWVRDVIVDQLRSYSNHTNSQSSPRDKKPPIIIEEHKRVINLEESIENISSYKEKSSEKKRQDLSISLPHEDSSLTIRPSNQVSQQSFSEEISYNEGDVEMHGLQEHPGKDQFIFHDDISEDQESSDQKQQERQVKGFRKVDPEKLAKKKAIQNQCFHEGPLLLDPDQQEQIDQKVMRKISVNQRKRPNQSYINLEQLRKYEMTPRHNSNLTKFPPFKPKSEIYKVDSGSEDSEEDEIIFNEDIDPQIKQITEQQVLNLVWEAAGQFFISTAIKPKLCRNKSKGPSVIGLQQKKSFIQYLSKQIPNFQVLKPRINQKMMASRLQLLRFMRVTFDDDDSSTQLRDELYSGQVSGRSSSDDGFEEIGKFQHILPADVCISALNKYLNLQQQNITKEMSSDEQKLIEKLALQSLGQKVPKQCIKKVIQRQKLSAHNKFQKQDLRKQIKKVQFHCIFDSLNQILMKRRLRTTGYSGIGLNQLTLIFSRQSFKQITSQQQFKQIEKQSLKELNQLIGTDKSSSQKLLMQNYEKLCENDSQWIYYTDQALSFALEFVYMLEDEIFFQEASLVSRMLRRL